jgi:hypothetical protein
MGIPITNEVYKDRNPNPMLNLLEEMEKIGQAIPRVISSIFLTTFHYRVMAQSS